MIYWYVCKECGNILKSDKETGLQCDVCNKDMLPYQIEITDLPKEELQTFVYKEKTRRKLGFILEFDYIIDLNGYKTLSQLTEEQLDGLL